jgi:hypothetical protein
MQIGYRIRGIAPADLALQPDSVKLMYWGWVVELGLKRKDEELAKGLDKDGKPLKPLKPETIKHRKSEVGTAHRNAPPLEPAYGKSRVRSLLTGRAHSNSAEFWWKFDPVSGRSFGEILQGQKKQGRDVFGLSPAGTAWVGQEALRKWEAWKARAIPARPPRTARAAMTPAREPVRVIAPVGTTNLKQLTAGPGLEAARTQRAIAAGHFTGFRGLNATGEQWTPGPGIPTETPPARTTPTQRQAVERALAVAFRQGPAAAARRDSVVLVDVRKLDEALAAAAAAGRQPAVASDRFQGEYRRFQRILLEARAAQRRILMPRLADDLQLDPADYAAFAVFRDEGASVIPVSVPRSQAKLFRSRFGASVALLKAVMGALRRA